MKVFWLILFLFSFAFGINSQIITGAYTLESSALKEEKILQNFLNKDKDFFEKNSLLANHKINNKYYLVTVEPITDEKILATALKKIKLKYKHAYTLKLPVAKTELSSSEPIQNEKIIETVTEATGLETVSIDSNNTATEENSTMTQTAFSTEQNTSEVIQTQEVIPLKEEPSVKEKVLLKEDIALNNESYTIDYQIIGLALFALTILAVLLFFLKKSFQKDVEQIEELPEQKHIQKEIEPEDSRITTTDDINFDGLNGLEEGTFGIKQPEEEIQNIGINLKKRAPIAHGKILKQDFKEFAGIRILVAEDNLINQKVITGLLGNSGIEVVVANNGKEALDILEEEENTFTLILMDAHMPIMDGFEATIAIRKNPKYNHIAIVALSGDISDSDIKKMLNAGMNEHLEKPLRIDALYDILYVYTDFKEENISYQTISNDDLNTEKGLVTCSGDEQFYHEILNEFLETYADSDTKIFEYLDANDFISADKDLLDIVGITSHIGAEKLNAVAKELKEALKDTQEKSYLTLAYHYSELLHKLIENIHEYK